MLATIGILMRMSWPHRLVQAFPYEQKYKYEKAQLKVITNLNRISDFSSHYYEPTKNEGNQWENI